MSVDNHGFVSWEEHIVCHERGRRVVHYYLKDGFGDLLLAIIGTERSIRHMTYVVSDEFLEFFGSNDSISASTKWRARREVVDLLTSMVSRQQTNSHDLGPLEASMTGFAACEAYSSEQPVQRKLKVQKSDVEWSGVPWICTKQLKHYPAFHRNRTTIAVHAFVLIMAEKGSHYLGYLEDMYEDRKGQKKVKVRWFHQSKEVKCVFPQLDPHPREVFITPHVQVISADCVDGLATVLTPAHYEKYETVHHVTPSAFFMCFRQLKNNKIKPFALTKLHGYSNQAILNSCADPIVAKQKVWFHDLNEEDAEQLTHNDLVRLGGKRNRSSKELHGLKSCLVNQKEQCETGYPKLKLRLSRKTMAIELIVPESQFSAPFNVNEKVELLCQDSGIRGCWFRCRVVLVSQNRLKVRYDDLQDVEGSGNLEEWVPACRVAAPDKLGMRCPGRHTIRPRPLEDCTSPIFEVGVPVDVWWSDGWWEGVISGVGHSGNDFVQVYLPGEDKIVMVQRKNSRTSRDWFDNKWVDVKTKPDIVCHLPADIISRMKMQTSECDSSELLEFKVATSSEFEALKKGKPLADSFVSADHENVKEVNFTHRPPIEGEDEFNIHGQNSCGDEEKGPHPCKKVQFPVDEDVESFKQISEAAKVLGELCCMNI